MYMSQEMPNLRHFLARFLPDDNNFGKYYLLINSLCVCRVALYIKITKKKED